MMKKLLFIGFLAGGIIVGTTVWAMHEDTAETRIEELSKRIRILEEEKTANASVGDWFDKIALSGLIEAEAGYEKYDPAGSEENPERTGDIVLSTFELGLDVGFCDHVSGHVLVLWEEDDTEPLDLDEGYISLTGPSSWPGYLHIGKMYIPFGSMNTYFISDPLTLELGETRESALMVGCHRGLCNIFGGVFNGDVDKQGKDDQVNAFFAGAEFSPPKDDDRPVNFTLGLTYLSNLADSDSLADMIVRTEEDDPEGLRDDVAGLSARLYLEMMHSLYCTAECVCAIDKFAAGELDFGGRDERLRPRAWNFEMVYITPAEIGIGIKYEETKDCDGFLPENRYGGIVFCSPLENTSLGLEYLRQKFDNDDKSHTITGQLAFEF